MTEVTTPVVLGLGSNLGDRRLNLRRAVGQLRGIVNVVRVSSVYETDPLDSPVGAPPFLNLVVAGVAALAPEEVLRRLHEIETRLGRRRGIPNAPRTIDIDLVLYGAAMCRGRALVVPHPRYTAREFVLAPLREFGLPWVDPASGVALSAMRGIGEVRNAGSLY